MPGRAVPAARQERGPPGRPSEGTGIGAGVGEGDFGEGPQAGQGGEQLVGGAGDEVPLGVEGGLEAGEEVVEDAAQLGQLG